MHSFLRPSPSDRGRRLAVGFVAILASLGLTAPTSALGAPATKVLRYRGYSVAVPESWPVYRLQADRTECVRFDRHAVYLGRPSSDQRCPAHAAGRTEAILVEPLLSRAGRSSGAFGQVLPLPSNAGAGPGQGSAAQLVNTSRGVIVTATWSQHPALIQHALGVRSLAAVAAASMARRRAPAVTAAVSRLRSAVRATAASAPSQPGEVYTGLGFDPCATPSSAQMSAWGSSPYRAIGVYVGGANMACSQPNLTASWMSQQSAAGWHMIPIYVGLQAPSNSCGCAPISLASAASQGTAAASDAVAQSQAVGLGAGNPIYYDMEAYTPSTANSPAVLAFLASWTAQLHASGYKSGVYGSADSGIRDLVSQVGTGYEEPDDIWIANWNEVQSTSDPNVPSGDWPAHQRLHQYDGGHDETHGGVTINIDGDYLDGATAAAGSGPPPVPSLPSLSVSPAADGGIELAPSWSGASGVSFWQVFAGAAASALAPVTSVVSATTPMPIVIHNAFAYFAARALGPAGQILGTSVPVATPAHVAIFGQSAFVPRRGLGGLPVGCFSAAPCQLTTTISAGGRQLASTGPEHVPVAGGLAYFSLLPPARVTLARARQHRLAVNVTVRDISGASASRQLTLIAFVTSGRSPRRSVSQSPALRIIGTTDFVSRGWVGGILAACFDSTPCHPSTTIAAAGKVIARTSPEFLGVNELGYLFFSLTPAGHAMFAHTPGNQLPARLTITTSSTTATATATLTARIVLASFS